MISIAYAQAANAASPPAPSGTTSLVLLVAMFVVFYFLLIRPQSKRNKEQKAMLQALKKGDEVITQGGVSGKIIDIGENFILLEVAENVHVKVQRVAVCTHLPKGSLNTL